MKRAISTVLAASLIPLTLSGCSLSRTTSSSTNSTHLLPSLSGCYITHIKNDKYSIKFTKVVGQKVEAEISFANSQKDSSAGNFVGSFDGKILTGIYSFSSEGMNSRRELFFKYISPGFVSGFGPVTVSGDLESLTRPLNLHWDTAYSYLPSKEC